MPISKFYEMEDGGEPPATVGTRISEGDDLAKLAAESADPSRNPVYQIVVEPIGTEGKYDERKMLRMHTTIGGLRVQTTDVLGRVADTDLAYIDNHTNALADIVGPNEGKRVIYTIYDDETASHEVHEL